MAAPAPVERAPSPAAPASRDESALPSPERAVSDESFESATPVDIASIRLDAPEQEASGVAEPERPAPSLDEALQRIPLETRRALDELLRARFTAVRRIRPGQMR